MTSPWAHVFHFTHEEALGLGDEVAPRWDLEPWAPGFQACIRNLAPVFSLAVFVSKTFRFDRNSSFRILPGRE